MAKDETVETITEDLPNPNLRIWDHGEVTDPKYTKEFKRPGGFKGTAPNAVYNVKRATEIFGPVGMGWGLDLISEEYIDGKPVFNDEGELVGSEKLHIARYHIWYMIDGKRHQQEVTGGTVFIGRNKNGWFGDEDAPKKTQTDAMTKGLSLLGFSADIYMGHYDDIKYVKDLRNPDSDDEPETTQPPAKMAGPIKPMTELQKHWRELAANILAQTELDGLIALKETPSVAALIEQLKVDVPHIWDMPQTEDGASGIKQMMTKKEAELIMDIER